MADEPTAAEAAAAAANAAAAQTDEEPVTKDDDWQAKARKHERDLKKERTAREALEAKLAEAAAASQTETERAIEQARKEAADAAKTEVSSTYQGKILNAEIRAQAAGKFANPKLAAKLLDLDPSDAFDEDGEVDTEFIASQIDGFLKDEDNAGLRAGTTTRTTRPSGDVDAGKGNGAPVGDMNAFIRSGSKR